MPAFSQISRARKAKGLEPDSLNLTDRNYWNKTWKSLEGDNALSSFKNSLRRFFKEEALFFDLIKKHLKEDGSKTVIEVGCAPGSFLVAFHKHFKFSVAGVDFADLSETKKNFESNHLTGYKLYQADFLKFNPPKKFDVVSSFGFIEHFTDYERVFKKHLQLLKKDGTLILEVPNFNHLQGFMHRVFDQKNYRRHNTRIMNLKVLGDLCEKHRLRILYLNYYKTIDFWIDKTDNRSFIKRWLVILFHIGSVLVNSLINIPSKNFSPYIVLIAKPETG
jgi:cyclopropane fatty-acyl-phospholipid synthase-like methyltransferase